jgi:protein LSM14
MVSKAPGTAQQYQNATEAATAAVAAAMAKLPGRQKQETSEAMDNLTRRVNEMRTDDNARHFRQQGTGGYVAGHRVGRSGRRGSFREHANAKPIEIPTTDFDFQSANAKFNKQDLAKEVIASGFSASTVEPNGSAETVATNGDAMNGTGRVKDEEVVIPPGQSVYDKKSSFFDNISSELKDRDEATRKKVGGPEFRSEERKKNMETFGQGSIDSYRGGYRGRGRRGYRGRGGFGGRIRGGYRGGRGAAQTTPTRTDNAAVEASGS